MIFREKQLKVKILKRFHGEGEPAWRTDGKTVAKHQARKKT